MNLHFHIIELQKRSIFLINLGKRAECCFFCPKRAFANFFWDFGYLKGWYNGEGKTQSLQENLLGSFLFKFGFAMCRSALWLMQFSMRLLVSFSFRL